MSLGLSDLPPFDDLDPMVELPSWVEFAFILDGRNDVLLLLHRDMSHWNRSHG